MSDGNLGGFSRQTIPWPCVRDHLTGSYSPAESTQIRFCVWCATNQCQHHFLTDPVVMGDIALKQSLLFVFSEFVNFELAMKTHANQTVSEMPSSPAVDNAYTLVVALVLSIGLRKCCSVLEVYQNICCDGFTSVCFECFSTTDMRSPLSTPLNEPSLNTRNWGQSLTFNLRPNGQRVIWRLDRYYNVMGGLSIGATTDPLTLP